MTESYTWGSGPGWCEMFLDAILKEYDMSEKKTFNTKTNEGCLTYGGGSYFYNGNEFPYDEWDMEVTFTKKPPQFKAGQKVRGHSESPYVYTVLAQWKDIVIVVDEVDDDVEYFGASELVHAS